MNTKNIRLLIWGFIFIPHFMLSQDNQKKLSEAQVKIQSIQREIKSLESQLQTSDNKLNIETKSIENIDKQIGLTQAKIAIYNKNIKENKIEINKRSILLRII
jgi:peptidoglycan hydrolase CwlO-like protein